MLFGSIRQNCDQDFLFAQKIDAKLKLYYSAGVEANQKLTRSWSTLLREQIPKTGLVIYSKAVDANTELIMYTTLLHLLQSENAAETEAGNLLYSESIRQNWG